MNLLRHGMLKLDFFCNAIKITGIMLNCVRGFTFMLGKCYASATDLKLVFQRSLTRSLFLSPKASGEEKNARMKG